MIPADTAALNTALDAFHAAPTGSTQRALAWHVVRRELADAVPGANEGWINAAMADLVRTDPEPHPDTLVSTVGQWAADIAGDYAAEILHGDGVPDATVYGYGLGLADALIAAAGCATEDEVDRPVTDAQLQAMDRLLQAWLRRHPLGR